MAQASFKAPFIHLKVHSAYSLSEGAIKIPKLLDFCQEHDMPAVAITDKANVFGAMEFSLSAVKKGVQPILGTTLRVRAPHAESKALSPARAQGANGAEYHEITLLVQSDTGYQNLMKLLSRCYMRDPVLVPLVIDKMAPGDKREHISIFPTTLEELEVLSDGLICLSGGEQGAINSYLLKGEEEKALCYLEQLKAIFKERFYLEIHRLGERIDPHTFAPLSASESITEPLLLKLATSQKVPIVATNSAYFLNQGDFDAHDALWCIADGKRLIAGNRRRSREGYRLRTPEEMFELFSDLPEALANTGRIAKSCSFILAPKKPALPPYDTKRGENEELKVQAEEGLEKRLETQVFTPEMTQVQKQEVKAKYFDRLAYEISVINKMGYAGYFLIVSDFIKYAKSKRIPVGPGRGSGAGSLVAWSLTITDVDPIRMNLIFERFLNPERVSMPDFDIDFCQEKRDKVIEYVCHKYGTDRVAQIVTFGKFQARMIIRDLCRVYGVPFHVSGDIAKLIPNDPTNPLTLQQAFDQDKTIVSEIKKLIPETGEELIKNALRLEGLYRHASTHAAGVVIAGEPLENIVALYRDTDAKTAAEGEDGAASHPFRLKDLPATQFNMKYVELTSLVKFDFLGLKTLSIMQTCIDMVLENKGIDINLSEIPLDDRKAFELLCRLETVGVFQLESAGMREVVRDLQPQQFEEIIALVALYRPGPMDDIPRYIACRNGQEEVRYAHPLMEDILKETYGVMVYQEQVMQIAQKLAGYGLGAADLLRRAMGKKIKSEMDAQREIFIKGCKDSNDIDEDLASQIFDQMAKFASYGFNKCHSAPYGLIAYQTAYLKANYPHEFMAAMMTFDMNNTDKLAVIREELQRMKITVLSPDINRSVARFKVEHHKDHGLCIRYALAAVKNVGEVNMDALVAEREKHGLFKSVHDFLERMDSTNVSKRTLEHFIMCGVFDSLDTDRSSLLNSVAVMLRHLGERKRRELAGQASLFGSGETSVLPPLKLEKALPWSKFVRAQHEFEALGLYLQEHPVKAYQDLLQDQNVSTFLEVKEKLRVGDEVTVNLAAVIVSKRERLSKSGTKFAFVQFSDPSGMFEGALFNESYAACKHLIEVGQTVFIRASLRCESADGDVKVSILNLGSLEDSTSQGVRKLKLKATSIEAIQLLYHGLLQTAEGQGQVVLDIEDDLYQVRINLPKRFKIGRETIETLSVIPNLKVYQ